jgi:hypothetical protein
MGQCQIRQRMHCQRLLRISAFQNHSIRKILSFSSIGHHLAIDDVIDNAQAPYRANQSMSPAEPIVYHSIPDCCKYVPSAPHNLVGQAWVNVSAEQSLRMVDLDANDDAYHRRDDQRE